jgi:hypothetical protein
MFGCLIPTTNIAATTTVHSAILRAPTAQGPKFHTNADPDPVARILDDTDGDLFGYRAVMTEFIRP